MDDLISRSALLEDISESVVFSGRSGETSAEMRGAHWRYRYITETPQLPKGE